MTYSPAIRSRSRLLSSLPAALIGRSARTWTPDGTATARKLSFSLVQSRASRPPRPSEAGTTKRCTASPCGGIGHTDGRGGGHIRLAEGDLLDFSGTDIRAVAHNQVSEPALEPEVAVFVGARQVSRAHPSIAQDLERCERVVPVPHHRVRCADNHLTHLAGRDVVLTGVHQPQRHANRRDADRPDAPLSRRRIHRVRPGLGHTAELNGLIAED